MSQTILPKEKLKVLLLGYYDSTRTRIAEAFLQEKYGDYFDIYCGGIEQREISPYAVKVMAERGLDLFSDKSENLENIVGKSVFDYVVTLCDKAKEMCPYFPGGKKYIHFNFPDPSGFQGNEPKILNSYRKLRDEIRSFIVKTFSKELRQIRRELTITKMKALKSKPTEAVGAVCEPAAVDRILKPFKEFARIEASGGLVLIVCVVVALILANTLGHLFIDFWDTYLTIGVGSLSLSKPLHLWINDGLMAVFFFVIGLEIKREGLVGELTSLKKAGLPIAAAVGGMIFPILIFTAINWGLPTQIGWGIPMATDIAIALGIITLLGKRVPYSLKVFLTAFAIVDDLGAVIVIAIFYTSSISIPALTIGFSLIVILLIINRVGVVNPLIYGLLGIILWLAFLLSGIHTTIAGILLALTIPTKTRITDQDFLEVSRSTLLEYERISPSSKNIMLDEAQSDAVRALGYASIQAQPLLRRFENGLLPWVSFLILPLFALSNAGIIFNIDIGQALTNPLTLGIILGLVFGKQIGIFLFTWIIVKTGVACLPQGVNWKHIYGTAWLGGVGFTMSIFISSLALNLDVFLSMAKIGILLASFISGLIGYLILTKSFPKIKQEG